MLFGQPSKNWTTPEFKGKFTKGAKTMNNSKKRKKLLLVLMLAAVGLGIEWYVYDTGQLKEHMTFLEWLLIQK